MSLLVILGMAALGLPAMVLQLMWIYRIHKDALTARAYEEISPGLALGVCFVPLMSYPWTAWTLRKLARFVDDNELDDPAAKRAVQAATWCLVLAILHAGMTTVGSAGSMTRGAWRGAAGGDADPFSNWPVFMMFWEIASAGVSLIALGVYVWTVRIVERVLYRHLGAQ